MNRRNFLRGSVGAAVAIALGRSISEAVEAEAMAMPPPFKEPSPVLKAQLDYLTSARDAWYIKDEPASGIRRFHRAKRTECMCPVLTRMPSCHRISPRFDARLCHVCGGYITDEHLEDHTSAGDFQDFSTDRMRYKCTERYSEQYSYGWDVARGPDETVMWQGTNGKIHELAGGEVRDLSEASLEEMLVEIQKWMCDTGKPISIVPRYAHIKIPPEPRPRPWFSWSVLDDPLRW